MSTKINALGNFRRNGARVNTYLQQRPKCHSREDVNIAVQVPAVYCDCEIARCCFERIEVSRRTRVANVQGRDRATDLIAKNRRGPGLVIRLREHARLE